MSTTSQLTSFSQSNPSYASATSILRPDSPARDTSLLRKSASDISSRDNLKPVADWESFITEYSLGNWLNGGVSIPDGLTPTTPTVEFNLQEGEDYYRVGITSKSVDTSSSVKDTFTQKGFLPAPHGPHEEERIAVCSRFGLDNLGRRKNLDRIALLAKEHFKVPLVVISVVLEDKEVFISSVGFDESENDEDYKQPVIPLPTSLCPHAMLRINPHGECLIMKEVKKDWRFKHNPYLKLRDGREITSFASANIFLPTSLLSQDESSPRKLPIGSVCLVDPDPRGIFGPEDEFYLKSLAALVAKEIHSGFIQVRQQISENQTAFLGQFLRNSLVLPCQGDFVEEKKNYVSSNTEPLSNHFSEAADALQDFTKADGAVVLDLRNFNAPHAPTPISPNAFDCKTPYTYCSQLPDPDSPPETADRELTNEKAGRKSSLRGGIFSGLQPGGGTITILGSSGYDWEKSIAQPDSKSSISSFLEAFYIDGKSEFYTSRNKMTSFLPLSAFLPASTTAFIACPIFDYDGKPALLLIITSNASHFRFESTDRQFVENVGAVAIGSLLRKRILEADRAKLAFVSQVSHELRTPLHAIGSQLELIKIVTSPTCFRSIKPLVDVAEVCVDSLREILDDTLTFAKMSNPTDSPVPARKLETVLLEELVEDVIKSTWSRAYQHAAIADRDIEVGVNGSGTNLKIIMEIDHNLTGVKASVDIGGLKRVLFNLVGNALKFTKEGSIKIALKLVSPLSNDSRAKETYFVTFNVVDTGVGMTEEFLKEQLFIPFRQLDSFSSGAGLGASICENIVKRMNGTLDFISEVGVGTTASVILPLKLFFPPKPSPSLTAYENSSSSTIRIISDELSDLLSPNLSNDSGFTLVHESPPKIYTPLINSPSSSIKKELPVGVADSSILVLVVDDNSIARKILTTFLTVKRVKFIEAVNGLEAVNAFKLYRPNLVWCDKQMPVLDGLEATRRMRLYEQENNLTPAYIVALSGLSDEDGSHREALNSGQINEWLTKGGRSLKILAEGLVRLEAELKTLSSRYQTAALLESLAGQLREGITPTADVLASLSSLVIAV